MTEGDARAWIAQEHGSDACARVAAFLDLVVEENGSQNLIAPGTIASIWVRHALDSAQLLRWAPTVWQTWLDIGTGGGFPGMIVAALAPDRTVVMAEPRRRRAEFLKRSITILQLEHATVVASRVEAVAIKADVISARAVATTESVLRAAQHCALSGTTWLLPRGRSGASMLEEQPTMFHVEHSLTDPASTILVGKGLP